MRKKQQHTSKILYPPPNTLIPIPHPHRITARLLLLLPPNSPIPEPSLLLPAPAIPILFIKLANRAQTAHILTDTRADLLQRAVEMPLTQGPFLRVVGRLILLLISGRVCVCVAVIFIFIVIVTRGAGHELLAHAGESGCHADVFEVGARVEGGLGREVGDGDFGVEDFGFEVDLQDCFPVRFRRQVDEQTAGEATEGGFVEVKGAVRGDHDEGGEFRHAVPFAQELVDEFAVTGSSVGAGAGTENGVCLVDKDDTRVELFGQGEDRSDVLFAFADVHIVHI